MQKRHALTLLHPVHTKRPSTSTDTRGSGAKHAVVTVIGSVFSWIGLLLLVLGALPLLLLLLCGWTMLALGLEMVSREGFRRVCDSGQQMQEPPNAPCSPYPQRLPHSSTPPQVRHATDMATKSHPQQLTTTDLSPAGPEAILPVTPQHNLNPQHNHNSDPLHPATPSSLAQGPSFINSTNIPGSRSTKGICSTSAASSVAHTPPTPDLLLTLPGPAWAAMLGELLGDGDTATITALTCVCRDTRWAVVEHSPDALRCRLNAANAGNAFLHAVLTRQGASLRVVVEAEDVEAVGALRAACPEPWGAVRTLRVERPKGVALDTGTRGEIDVAALLLQCPHLSTLGLGPGISVGGRVGPHHVAMLAHITGLSLASLQQLECVWELLPQLHQLQLLKECGVRDSPLASSSVRHMLACATRLQSLSLPDSVLGTGDVHTLLRTAPRVRQVGVLECHWPAGTSSPGAAPAPTPRWSHLTVSGSPFVQTLASIPLDGLSMLHLHGMHFDTSQPMEQQVAAAMAQLGRPQQVQWEAGRCELDLLVTCPDHLPSALTALHPLIVHVRQAGARLTLGLSMGCVTAPAVQHMLRHVAALPHGTVWRLALGGRRISSDVWEELGRGCGGVVGAVAVSVHHLEGESLALFLAVAPPSLAVTLEPKGLARNAVTRALSLLASYNVPPRGRLTCV